jgi:hypothetical protein
MIKMLTINVLKESISGWLLKLVYCLRYGPKHDSPISVKNFRVFTFVTKILYPCLISAPLR